MGGRALGIVRAMAAVSAACLAMPALPQFTLQGEGGAPGAPAQLKGKPAVDLMPGIRRGLGFPLRNDNIVPGSEEVFIGGKKLAKDQYTIDCPSGVLYVSVPVQQSDSIRVIYRHDPDAKKSTLSPGALPLMTMNFGNGGSMSLLMGIGGADRENGTVMQSNNLGFKSSFNFGSAAISGLFMRSSKENAFVEGDSASPDNNQVQEGESSSGMLIKQAANIGVGNGMNVTAEYQDIDAKFTGFGMLASSGLGSEEIKQLEKEKGITRMGLGFNGGSANSVLFKNNYRTIDDGKGKIEFHDYGFKTGSIEAYYSARDIDSSFSRFKDIAEENREQLKKEKGISRQSMGAAFNFSGAKLSFDQNSISLENAGIDRQSFAIDSGFLKGSFKTQSIDQNFSRTGDLAEGEREQWGRERGFSRKELDFSIPKGDKSLLTFSNKNVDYDGRGFDAKAFGLSAGSFGVQYWKRSADDNFQRLNDLSKPELSAMAQEVLNLYDSNAKVRDADIQSTAREAGLSREMLRFDTKPFKTGSLTFSKMGIDAAGGGLSRDVFDLNYDDFKIGYKRTNIDHGFNRIPDLLEIERNLYGNQVGFDRSEMNFSGKVGKGFGFSMDKFSVQDGGAGLDRFTTEIKGAGFELKAGMRNVDQSFTRTMDINDPERHLFSELIGYNQRDVAFKFDAIRGIKLSGMFFDADNGKEDKHRFRNEAGILLNPDSKTEFEISYRDHKYLGIDETLFENNLMRFRGSRDFGNLGKLTLMHETESFGGSETETPSRDTNYLKYETKIGKNFGFTTEQGRTNFATGGFENYQAYKLDWQVNKRLGLNVEQVFVDRDGRKPDNQSTNFGFKYDFGNNLKLGYTFRENMDSVVGGKRSFGWEMTEGNFGGFNVGGGYSQNSETGREDSFLGNFSLANPKAFDIGFLKDIKISLGYNGKNEVGEWKNEKRLGDFSAKILGSEFGLNYSQVMLPGAVIAADRAARFNLDPSGKRPLQLAMAYKVRTLPNGENYVIRDFDASYKLGDVLTISHTTDDLPEVKANNTPFGTNVKPTLGRKWDINYKATSSVAAIFGYEELSDMGQRSLYRKATFSLSFLENTGSPIRLTYAMEQNDRPADGRRSRNEYKIAFEQKPGANQTFSLMLGMVDWNDGLPEGELWNRALLNVDYQLRF